MEYYKLSPSSDPQTALNHYIYDYLVKGGCTLTASAFINEKNLNLEDLSSLKECPESFLLDWWEPFFSVFNNHSQSQSEQHLPQKFQMPQTSALLAQQAASKRTNEDLIQDSQLLNNSKTKGKNAKSSKTQPKASPFTHPTNNSNEACTRNNKVKPQQPASLPVRGRAPAAPPLSISLPPNSLSLTNWPGNQTMGLTVATPGPSNLQRILPQTLTGADNQNHFKGDNNQNQSNGGPGAANNIQNSLGISSEQHYVAQQHALERLQQMRSGSLPNAMAGMTNGGVNVQNSHFGQGMPMSHEISGGLMGNGADQTRAHREAYTQQHRHVQFLKVQQFRARQQLCLQPQANGPSTDPLNSSIEPSSQSITQNHLFDPNSSLRQLYNLQGQVSISNQGLHSPSNGAFQVPNINNISSSVSLPSTNSIGPESQSFSHPSSTSQFMISQASVSEPINSQISPGIGALTISRPVDYSTPAPTESTQNKLRPTENEEVSDFERYINTASFSVDGEGVNAFSTTNNIQTDDLSVFDGFLNLDAF